MDQGLLLARSGDSRYSDKHIGLTHV